MSDIYTPPKVWTLDTQSGGHFASINRPVAGATHDKGCRRRRRRRPVFNIDFPGGRTGWEGPQGAPRGGGKAAAPRWPQEEQVLGMGLLG